MATSFLDRLFHDPALDIVTKSQLATAICLGVRLAPVPNGRELSEAIAEAEKDAEAEAPANQMQKTLASDLGVSFDKSTSRSQLCMQLLNAFHSDPESFASRPSAAFQDRFCGGPFSRFGDWMPTVEIKPDRTLTEAAKPLHVGWQILLSIAIVCLPFVALWYLVKAVWNALFG